MITSLSMASANSWSAISARWRSFIGVILLLTPSQDREMGAQPRGCHDKPLGVIMKAKECAVAIRKEDGRARGSASPAYAGCCTAIVPALRSTGASQTSMRIDVPDAPKDTSSPHRKLQRERMFGYLLHSNGFRL